MTTRFLGQACSSLCNSGRMCIQLMQQKVQKSRSTNFPLRSCSSRGPAVLSQTRFWGSGGTFCLREKGKSGSLAWAGRPAEKVEKEIKNAPTRDFILGN